MKKALASLTFIFLVQGLFAQDTNLVFKRYHPKPSVIDYQPSIVFDNVFVGDYLMGVGSGFYEKKNNWAGRLAFDFRPNFRTVTFNENDTLRNQYKEKDFYLHLSLEKEFSFKVQYPLLRPFVQADFGLLWGNFKAFKKAPESKWIFSPSAGLNLALRSWVGFKLGYQYMRPLVLQTSPHRIVFQIMFIIDEQ